MTTAVVFDYGFGNVRSMVRALANLGVDTTLTSDYRQSLEADGLVVPGVGAFAACMEGLKKVDGDRLKKLGASGIMEVGNNLQVIFGPQSDNIKTKIQEIIARGDDKASLKTLTPDNGLGRS